VLPALLCPAAALGGAGADKIALHVGEAAENGNHQAPVLVLVSAHGSASERNCAFASTICLTMAADDARRRCRRPRPVNRVAASITVKLDPVEMALIQYKHPTPIDKRQLLD
jgi:hypothetical protein